MHVEKINISNPCPEDIELMDGDGPRVHCNKCDKHVHNLSNLTREEAEELLAANQGGDLCINYRSSRTGEIGFHREGSPRPSSSQLAGVKKLLLAAVLVPLILTQPAIVPAKVALNVVYESVGTNDGPIDVIKNIMNAETALLDRLENEYGFKPVEVRYSGGANDAVVNDVTF